MTVSPTLRRARSLAFTAGLLLAGAIAVAGRVPAATTSPGVELTVRANPTGELAVSPAGVVLRAPALGATGRPATARGRLAIRNQTDATLAVSVRQAASGDDVSDVVSLGIPRRLRLAPHEQRALTLTAKVDPRDRSAYAGRAGDITLELRSTVLARRHA